MIPGIAPAIIRNQAPAPSGYSFTMTAGNYFGAIQGYGNSPSEGFVFGEIDDEPIPAHSLGILCSGALNQCGFHGDVLSLVSGKTVWVEGVPFPFDGADWLYYPESGNTGGIWVSSGPVFVENGVYFIEIK